MQQESSPLEVQSESIETPVAHETPHVPAKVRPGLLELLKAYRYADELTRDVWDFAVEIKTLRTAGLTNSEFRWLVCKDYVEHAREVTVAGDGDRGFQQPGNLVFPKRSCFVLTESGSAIAKSVQEMSAPEAAPGFPPGFEQGAEIGAVLVPAWDPDRHEFRVGEVLVKRYSVPSPNQETLLTAFEEEGWPLQIDDPLPPAPELDPKRRLHDTIRGLNRNQKNRVIRFMGDGTGEGVRWLLIEEEPHSQQLQSG